MPIPATLTPRPPACCCSPFHYKGAASANQTPLTGRLVLFFLLQGWPRRWPGMQRAPTASWKWGWWVHPAPRRPIPWRWRLRSALLCGAPSPPASPTRWLWPRLPGAVLGAQNGACRKLCYCDARAAPCSCSACSLLLDASLPQWARLWGASCCLPPAASAAQGGCTHGGVAGGQHKQNALADNPWGAPAAGRESTSPMAT